MLADCPWLASERYRWVVSQPNYLLPCHLAFQRAHRIIDMGIAYAIRMETAHFQDTENGIDWGVSIGWTVSTRTPVMRRLQLFYESCF